MVSGFYGKKIGMTQLFSGNKVIPATVIDVSLWYVVDVKTEARDGYHAIQVGKIKKRYEKEQFSPSWIAKKKDYFTFVREIRLENPVENVEVGKLVDFYNNLSEGDSLRVTGTTKGCGFAGVVRRHNFAGGSASHGNRMGRRPGSLGFMTKSGRVIKGKKMPGHMGNKQRTMQNLKLVKVLKDDNAIVVKGSIPGKAGSLVFVRKEVA